MNKGNSRPEASRPGLPFDDEPLSCSICLCLFVSPATLPCGHTFCTPCITRHWRCASSTEARCPQCCTIFKPELKLSTNVSLASMVESFRKIHRKSAQEGGGEETTSKSARLVAGAGSGGETSKSERCAQHGRSLEVFCRTDKCCICTLCVLKEHKGHDAVLVETEYEERLGELRDLQQETRRRIKSGEKRLDNLQSTLDSIKTSATALSSDCERLARRLQQQLKPCVVQKEAEAVGAVQQQRRNLQGALQKLRHTSQQLTQLQNSSKSHLVTNWSSVPIPPELCLSSTSCTDPFKKIKDALTLLSQTLTAVCGEDSEVISVRVSVPQPADPEIWTRVQLQQYSCALTLDPDTAHRELELSENNTTVHRLPRTRALPKCAKRFTQKCQVLCREALQHRCYWEVELEGNRMELGLTYHCISRSGNLRNSSFGGNSFSWSLDCIQGQYSVCHNNQGLQLTTGRSYERIGCFLQFEMGLLSFYGVSDDVALIYRVSADFTEPLYAGFWLGEGSKVRICPLEFA